MPSSIHSVKAMLAERGVHFRDGSDPHSVVMSWTTERYRDPDTGDKSAFIVVRLEEEGRFIKVFSPQCFRSEVPHKLAFLEALLGICWRTKLLQFEFDASDGEVRAMVEWPIEDSTLTWKQIHRAILALVLLLDKYHDLVVKAGRSGVVSWMDESDSERAAEIQSTLQKLRRLLGR